MNPITEQVLLELQEIEDAVHAYENNYYDTHDLDAIEENIEEYRNTLKYYKQFLPDKTSRFCEYEIKNGICKIKS